jgi:hypothetical protein
MSRQPWRDWPALTDLGDAPRWRFACLHAVWGKRPGDATDARWIGASAALDSDFDERAAAFYLGSEDAPADLLGWHSRDGLHQAIHGLPSRFPDAAGRHALERHILEWRNRPKLPAALAALAMLPQAAALDADAWQPLLDPATPPEQPASLPRQDTLLDPFALAAAIDTGCDELARAVGEAELTRLYALVLAGNRFVQLPAAAELLRPQALAALLLPMQRELADQLSLLSRLPSRRIDRRRFGDTAAAAVRWHLIGIGDCPAEQLPAAAAPASPEQEALATAMARALLANQPGLLRQPPAARKPAVTAPQRKLHGAKELRIWGSSSSGKTAYLARLFTKFRSGGDPSWSVRLPPGADRAWFELRVDNFQTQNEFPEPTARGTSDQLVCRLVNQREGREATIAIEDRPGGELEAFEEATALALANADGLLLLLDPRRDPARQNAEVQRAFIRMQQQRNDPLKDDRPVAVCISKCDQLIHDMDDYHHALQQPEALLLEHIGGKIKEALDHYFSNYRVFALSAAGLRIVHGTVQPSVFYDETLKLRVNADAQPMNLLEPLLWLLDELQE